MLRDKKVDELIVMRYFAEKYPEFPNGKLIQHESPDFILKLNRRKHINIELTQLTQTFKESSIVPSGLLKSLKILIQKKNEKLSLYNRNKPFQNWLIIYSEYINHTVAYGIENQLTKNAVELIFDQIFLLDLFNGRILNIHDATR